MIEIKGKFTDAIVYSDYIDTESMSQITKMVNSPGITNPVRIMPDFHAGKGSVIGFTMPVGEYIIPSITGVDIGCGMLSANLTGGDFTNLSLINNKIREVVPLGFNIHSKALFNIEQDFLDLTSKIGIDSDRMVKSIGTLGGGNHFIEIGVDEGSQYWVTIHSGSRNFGLQVANFHQKRAVDYCKENGIDVEKGMEFEPVKEYLEDMYVAQRYAQANRDAMLCIILTALNSPIDRVVNCIHNYISPKDNIIRKGAVSAHPGDGIILPFNRKDGIWIMTGKGNPDWNFSAPHGAGRKMSRSQAKRDMTQAYVDEDMLNSGVFSSYNPIDEAPDAYKSPEEIKQYIGETAEYLFSIKPVLNIKG
jgi:tRNA-splicing ligase RtcB